MEVVCVPSGKLTSSEHCYKTLSKGLFFPVPMYGGSATPPAVGSSTPVAAALSHILRNGTGIWLAGAAGAVWLAGMQHCPSPGRKGRGCVAVDS